MKIFSQIKIDFIYTSFDTFLKNQCCTVEKRKACRFENRKPLFIYVSISKINISDFFQKISFEKKFLFNTEPHIGEFFENWGRIFIAIRKNIPLNFSPVHFRIMRKAIIKGVENIFFVSFLPKQNIKTAHVFPKERDKSNLKMPSDKPMAKKNIFRM